ncbi:MAG: biopolymer transporter ExbD [Pseudomonadota bacterium]
MRGRSTRPVEEAEVNLTPMLDVVFILLIFFIVTSTFAREQALKLEPPPPPPPLDQPPPESRAILIYVNEESLIRVNGRLTDVGAVRANIERLRAESPDSAVIIQAHPRARNGVIVEIRDQTQSANVEKVNLVLSGE